MLGKSFLKLVVSFNGVIIMKNWGKDSAISFSRKETQGNGETTATTDHV